MKDKIVEIGKRSSKAEIILYIFLAINMIIAAVSLSLMIYYYFNHSDLIRNCILYKQLFTSIDSNDTFMDFFNSITLGWNPYSQASIYPPLMTVIYAILGSFIPSSVMASGSFAIRSSQAGILCFFVYSMIVGIVYIVSLFTLPDISFKKKCYLLITSLFTLPFLYCFERGNCIILAFSLSLIFVNCYRSSKKTTRILSYIALAAAVSIKIYPAVLGLLLIRHRKWKEAIFTVGIGLAVLLLPLLFLNEKESIATWINNIINCSASFESAGTGLKLNLSNSLQILTDLTGMNFSRLSNYCVALVVGINCLVVVINTRIDEWKAISLLSILTVLVPGFSWRYCMIFMFIPFYYFVIDLTKRKSASVWDYFYLILFVLMFFVLLIHNQYSIYFSYISVGRCTLDKTTIIESAALIMMEIGIVFEFFHNELMFRQKGKEIVSESPMAAK